MFFFRTWFLEAVLRSVERVTRSPQREWKVKLLGEDCAEEEDGPPWVLMLKLQVEFVQKLG